jgi:hypothetical protein
LPSRIAVRSYRWLRLKLPGPLSVGLGRLAYLPYALRRGESPREFLEESVIERLATTDAPLLEVGAGLSERVIEIPWVMRRLDDRGARRVLDVGTAFSPMVYKRLLIRRRETIDVADLAETHIPGLRSHIADVRELPFETGSFDVAICISTLEHIGMINSQYEIDSGGGGDLDALRELGRVARRVLVTVPGGADADMGWQRQYSPQTFRRLVANAGLHVAQLDVFVHDPDSGWAPATEASIGDRSYGDGSVAAAASICTELARP